MAQILQAEPYVKSILYPARELTEGEIKDLRQSAIDGLLAVALATGIGADKSEIVIREGMPNADFGVTNENWVTAALNANAWNAGVINNAMGNAKAACFWGVFNADTNPQISAIRWRLGANGTGATKVQVEIQDMLTELQNSAYMSPVFYKPNDTVYIDYYGLAAVTQKLGFRVLVAERVGNTLTGGLV